MKKAACGPLLFCSAGVAGANPAYAPSDPVTIQPDACAPGRPAPVELAAYRVAQEALVNALKHGAPPITVSYAATLDSVTLSIDDAGAGIDLEAPERAEREGRLGLASMAQRAEAVGARLVLATRVGGGTHVGMEWTGTGA